MKVLNSFKIYLISFLILFGFTIFYTIFLYFNILKASSVSYNIITLLFGLLTYYLISHNLTISSKSKGWLKGLLIGIILTILLFLIRSFHNLSLNLSICIKYLCYTVIASLAGILNVNKNKEK